MKQDEDLSAPLNYTEEEMKRLGERWSTIYRTFLSEVDLLISEAGGKEMLQIEVGKGGIRDLRARFE